jgi:transcriptional regulator with XRE-family HTH domain
MISIGQRMKNFRKASDFSQQTLAELLGVSRPTISQIENGERKICAEELVKLAEIFNTSVDRLINPEKEPSVIIQESRDAYRKEP